jgi:glycosyltransferase involved in cell wall biosynthesis
MTYKKDSITVLLPAHNASATILPAIYSILNQTHQNLELWVLENGSHDNTAQLAKSINDKRLRVFELGPIGFQNALTFGVQNANTELLARMDADDIALPNRLSTQIKFMNSNTDIAFCGTSYYHLLPSGHVISIKTKHPHKDRFVKLDAFAMGDNPSKRYFADPSVVFRRSCALSSGLYDEEYPIGDVGMWLKMLQKYIGFELSEKLLIYRVNQKSMSSAPTSWQYGLKLRHKYLPVSLLSKMDDQFKGHNINAWISRNEFLAGCYNDALEYLKYAEGYEIGKYERLESRIKLRWIYRLYQRYLKNQYVDRRVDLENYINKISYE